MEKLLHYLWRFKLHGKSGLTSIDGKQIRIIDVGTLNTNAGPDFFNAKLEIDGTVWAGNIEIHQRSSDWERHRHHTDSAYDSVILHVTGLCDKEVFNSKGEKLLQLELKVTDALQQELEFFMHQNNDHPCVSRLQELSSLLITGVKNRLLVERLEQKTADVQTLLEHYRNNWEEVLYVRLLRAFGTGINGDAFERLARSLPLTVLQKHADRPFQLEALLLGQAGLLKEQETDNDYENALSHEYRFLKAKYSLEPMEKSCWKMLRLRPSNFPHLRMAQIAAIYHRNAHSLFSQIKEQKSELEVSRILSHKPSEYWQKHFSFGTDQHDHSGRLGRTTLDILIINAVIPLVFAFGKQTGDSSLCERTFSWLEAIAAEQNNITRQWTSWGLESLSAADSQALIQLENEYCRKKKCLFCQIGHKLLAIRYREGAS